MPALIPFPFWRVTGTPTHPNLEIKGPAAQNHQVHQIQLLGGTYGALAQYQYNYGGAVYASGTHGPTTVNDYYTSVGGYLYLYAGNGGYTSGKYSYSRGGNAYLFGGQGRATTDYYAKSYGGSVYVSGGNAGSTTQLNAYSYGGSTYIGSGRGGAANNSYSGNIVIQAASNLGNYYSNAGAVRIFGGAASGTYGYGGDVRIIAGDASGAVNKFPGDVLLRAGAPNGNVIMDTIPNADPAVSGALFFDPVTNIVHRSP